MLPKGVCAVPAAPLFDECQIAATVHARLFLRHKTLDTVLPKRIRAVLPVPIFYKFHVTVSVRTGFFLRLKTLLFDERPSIRIA
jgi:hypothetical protein